MKLSGPFFLILLTATSFSTQAASTDLFFSEYVEGSSNNKGLEIYNGTGATVVLDGNYSIEAYHNGSTTPSFTIALSGSITDGDVHVIANPSATFASDQTSGSLTFNGDDTLLLKHGDSIVDSFGQLGVDPGSAWGTGDTSSANHSLRRKPSISAGDIIPDNAFDPIDEWDGFAIDSFDGLGAHALDGIDPAPFVAGISPANGSTSVAIDTAFSVLFSEDVIVTPLVWYEITCSISGNVTANVTGGPAAYTISPTIQFTPGETCTLTVRADQVSDSAGNTMAVDEISGFDIASSANINLIFSEIMYDPASPEDNWEWIEIYNAGANTVDLSGFVIDDNNASAHPVANISGGSIAAGERAILFNADDLTASDFALAWGAGINLIPVTNWGAMALNNGGDRIALWADFASYSGDHAQHANALISFSYPDLGANTGSIYLVDLVDPTNPGNWLQSDLAGVVTPLGSVYASLNAGGNVGNELGSPGGSFLPQLVISEIMFNPASPEDNWEWIEIYNAGATSVDLSGFVIDDINASAHTSANIASGSIAPGQSAVLYNADDILAADFEAAWGAGINLVGVTNWGAMALNNGGDTLALWTDFASYSGDHAAHANALVSVAYPGDLDDGFGSIYLADLSDQASWSLSSNGAVSPLFTAYTSSGAGGNSGSDVASPGPNGGSTGPGPGEITLISTIQGDGASSPLAGETVTISAIVTAVFQGNGLPVPASNNELNGFFVQEEDVDADSDPNTSEGIFVFNTSTPVSVGDLVEVTGNVIEFFNLTEIGGGNSVNVISSANALPSATLISDLATARNSALDLERFEGMLLQFSQNMTVSEYFELGRFGEVVLFAGQRPFQFTHDNAPDITGFNTHQETIRLNRIIIDDASSAQNPPVIPFGRNGNALSRDNILRGGDTTSGLFGVLNYSFGEYKLHPVDGLNAGITSPVFLPGDSPRPLVAPEVGGRLKVAGFNVLNYFTTLDTGSPVCGPSGGLDCRGADNADELTRQTSKIVNALMDLDADIVGLVELENNSPFDANPGNTADALASLVDALNTAIGSATYAYIDSGTIGSDAIRVGLIYKSATIQPSGLPAVLDSSVDQAFIDSRNRPALAQTFEEIASGALLTVAVNHFKSKGSACDDIGDTDAGDGQGNCNGTRTSAAIALANWLASDPTGSGDADFLILGDLNASVDITIAGLGDLSSPSLGAFFIDVSFDNSLFGLDLVSFGDLLNGNAGDPLFSDRFVDDSVSGIVSLSETSFLFDFELDALQPASFTLATLDFTALATGSGALDFALIDLSDELGFSINDATGAGTTVTVPEPPMLALMSAGLIGIGFGRRRYQRR